MLIASSRKIIVRTAAFFLLALIITSGPCLTARSAERTEAKSSTASSDEPEEIGLEALLTKIYLAYGGKDVLAKFNNNCQVSGEQKSLSDDAAESQKHSFRTQRRGDALRIDIEGENGWTTTVYDGLRAWNTVGKTVVDLDPDKTKDLILEKDRQPAVLVCFSNPDYDFKLRGSTLHRAIPVYAIEVSRSGNQPVTLYIDKKNYLVTGISYSGINPETGKEGSITIDYSEYRPAAGSLVPFKQTEFINNQPLFEFAVQSVELNTLNDDQPFRRPDRPNDIRLEKAVIVPFLYSHKEVLVKARINDGEPLDFLFDTGATQTLIDRRIAAENLLDRQANRSLNAAGGTVTGQSTEISKLTLGDVSLVGIQAMIVDLSGHARQLGKPIAGVLGNNVLNHFTVCVDYGKSVIRLYDYSNFKPATGATILPFEDKKGPTIKALINGKDEVTFMVDTGAAFNNLPSAIAKKYAAGQPAHYTEGIGVDGKAIRLGTLNIASVKLSSTSARDISFTYSAEQDLNTSKKGFVGGSSIGILGNPFWQNFTLIVDYRLHRLVLQANPQLASRQQLEQLINTGDSKLNIYRDFRAAEIAYQSALAKVQYLADPKQQARVWGRLGNLHRIMAKDLGRPEQSRIAYEYFSKSQALAHKTEDREIEGRILADWALLYMDNGQLQEARQALDGAMAFAAQDPQVNVNFAVFLNKLRSYGDMRAYIDKALFLEPSNWQALFYRLKLAEMFGDFNLQKETLREILRYYPWSKVAQDKLNAFTSAAGVVDVSKQPAKTTP